MTRGLGYRPDPVDGRDKLFSAHPRSAVSLPASVSLWDPRCEIKDQAWSSACTGMAWSQAIRLAYLREGIPCPDLSATYLYYLGRAEHGSENEDAGSYLRTVASAAKKFGVADEGSWGFDIESINRQPSMRALHSGFDRRGIRGYHRVDAGDPDNVRRALAAGFPVVAGWQVSEAFMEWDGSGIVRQQHEPFVGGHAMCVVGYSANGTFDLANSWGQAFGLNGFVVTDETFIQQASDAWVVDV